MTPRCLSQPQSFTCKNRNNKEWEAEKQGTTEEFADDIEDLFPMIYPQRVAKAKSRYLIAVASKNVDEHERKMCP